MPATRHRIQFPPAGSHNLAQDEAFFYVVDGPERKKRKLLLHDYDQIYERTGSTSSCFTTA